MKVIVHACTAVRSCYSIRQIIEYCIIFILKNEFVKSSRLDFLKMFFKSLTATAFLLFPSTSLAAPAGEMDISEIVPRGLHLFKYDLPFTK